VQHREQLAKQCEALSITQLELVRDVPTRWNSTLDMIEWASSLHRVDNIPDINSSRQKQEVY
jgi:hypothetical protein